jgi:predicted ATPase
LLGPEQPLWFGRLEADLANLHAALDWLRSGGHALLALRLAGALGLLWTWPPYLREGRTRLRPP